MVDLILPGTFGSRTPPRILHLKTNAAVLSRHPLFGLLCGSLSRVRAGEAALCRSSGRSRCDFAPGSFATAPAEPSALLRCAALLSPVCVCPRLLTACARLCRSLEAPRERGGASAVPDEPWRWLPALGALSRSAGARVAVAGRRSRVLWEHSRGATSSHSVDEAVKLDDAARARVGGSAGTWPATLTYGDPCWHEASHAWQKELTVESDVCKYLHCREALGSPKVACLAAVCAK